MTEANLAGVVGIHYEEARHIFSGVPELEVYLPQEPQLYGLISRVQFNDISLPDDFELCMNLSVAAP